MQQTARLRLTAQRPQLGCCCSCKLRPLTLTLSPKRSSCLGERGLGAFPIGQAYLFTLSITSATGCFASVATCAGCASRSPDCGIALPDLLMRAETCTFGNDDSLNCGAIAIASVRVMLAGNADAFSLATASGIDGPLIARA